MKSAIRRNAQWIAGSLATAAILVGLAACTPSVNVGSPVPENIIPEGLKDCVFYKLTTANGLTLHVARCPNSSTSVARVGKNPVYTTTVDGGPANPTSEQDEQKRLQAEISKTEEEIRRLKLKAENLRSQASKE